LTSSQNISQPVKTFVIEYIDVNLLPCRPLRVTSLKFSKGRTAMLRPTRPAIQEIDGLFDYLEIARDNLRSCKLQRITEAHGSGVRSLSLSRSVHFPPRGNFILAWPKPTLHLIESILRIF